MKKSTKTFKCSDPSQNVYGMTVNTAGIRLDAFLLNPVCLLNHNYDMVMGAWAEVQKIGNTLSGVPEFDTEDPDANKYYGQVERDVIKGASIGIIPITVEGTEIVESELLEISITPVPANRNALVIYNAKGQKLNAKEAKAYMLSINDTKTDLENNTKTMNPKFLAALLTLCAQAEVTLQLSATSTDDEVQNGLTAIGNKITALKLSNTELKASNDVFKTAADNAKTLQITEMVELAISEKRITADKKETFIKLAVADFGLAKSTLEGLTSVQLTAIPGAVEAKEGEEKAGWSFDQYAEKAPLELSAMETANPEQFNKLYSAKVAAMKASGAIS